MIITKEGMPFIKEYVSSLNIIIKEKLGGKELSKIQSWWLQFVILGILVTNSFCWSRFERFSVDEYQKSALCWVFRKASIAWELLLQASILYIIQSYGIKFGTLVIDDTDIERSKNVTQIGGAHKIKDKKTGGYFLGQNIVFIILVTNEITIPVGFKFYTPDPVMTAWKKEELRLIKKKVEKKYRPLKPEPNPKYPTKIQLAQALVKEFAENFPSIVVKAIAADCAYNTDAFITECSKYCKDAQVISEIRDNQLVFFGNKYQKVSDIFTNFLGTTENIILRNCGRKITYRSAKLKVKSHGGKKLFVIALKYEGEENYRYLIAKDMRWRDIDVIKSYALRWLVEVFIQDWKSYEGWDNMAKQRGVIGADRGVLLSLLCDHALHLHETQLASYKNKEPAITTGSLREKVMCESLMTFIQNIVLSENPQEVFDTYSAKLSELFELKTSTKHLRGFTDIKENVIIQES
jgi:hypothetical protein